MVPLLSDSFCSRLVQELQHFNVQQQQRAERSSRPNSMNKYGTQLREVGLGPWINEIMKDIVPLLSAMLFPDWGGTSITSEHTFTVSYR